MLVLLDECVPRPLRNSLPGHVIRTVGQMKWNGLKNGKLLAAMRSAGMQVFITIDKSMNHQQNIAASGVAVLLVDAPSNDIDDMLSYVPGILTALQSIQPGDFIVVK